MKRINISSGTQWEPIIGYSRAVRAGDVVYVSGTTATDAEGKVVGVGNPYKQTLQALKNISNALVRAGSRMEEVVRTRIFVTRIADWEQVGRAHGEFFSKVRPATAMLEVGRLINPDMLVEIEAEAVLGARVTVSSKSGIESRGKVAGTGGRNGRGKNTGTRKK